ncbi:trichohyalin isoform X2 [Halyomorpha halys]
MRKTRLVILPGVRSITQIGCLLLFLACPTIAFKGQEKRDVEPICKFHELKYWWLPFDTGEKDNSTISQKSTGYQCQWDKDMIKGKDNVTDSIQHYYDERIISHGNNIPGQDANNNFNINIGRRWVIQSLPGSSVTIDKLSRRNKHSERRTLERNEIQQFEERSRMERRLERALFIDKERHSSHRSERSVKSRFYSLDRRIVESHLRRSGPQEKDINRRTRSEMLRDSPARLERRETTQQLRKTRDLDEKSRINRRVEHAPAEQKQRVCEMRSKRSTESRDFSTDRKMAESKIRRDIGIHEMDNTRRIRSETLRDSRNEIRDNSRQQYIFRKNISPVRQEPRETTQRSAFINILPKNFAERSRMDRFERGFSSDTEQRLSNRSKRSVESRVLSLDRRTSDSNLGRDNGPQENDTTRRFRSEIRGHRTENRENISPVQNTFLRHNTARTLGRRDSTRRLAFALQSRDFEERTRMNMRIEPSATSDKEHRLLDRRSSVRSVGESRVFPLDRTMDESNPRRDVRLRENDSTRRIRAETLRESRNDNREKISPAQNNVFRQNLSESLERGDSTQRSASPIIQSRNVEERSRLDRRLGRAVTTDKEQGLSEVRRTEMVRDSRNGIPKNISPKLNTRARLNSPERRETTQRSTFAKILSQNLEVRSRIDRFERFVSTDKEQRLSERRLKRSLESRVSPLNRRVAEFNHRRDTRINEKDSSRRIRSEKIIDSRNENREVFSPVQNSLFRQTSLERQELRDSTRRSAFAIVQSRDFERRFRMDRRLERAVTTDKEERMSEIRKTVRSVESHLFSHDRRIAESNLRQEVRLHENDSIRRTRSEMIRYSRSENRENLSSLQNTIRQRNSWERRENNPRAAFAIIQVNELDEQSIKDRRLKRAVSLNKLIHLTNIRSKRSLESRDNTLRPQNTLRKEISPVHRETTQRSKFANILPKDLEERSRMDRRFERVMSIDKEQRFSDRSVGSAQSHEPSLDRRMDESNLRRDIGVREKDSTRRIRSETLRDSRNEKLRNSSPLRNSLLRQQSPGHLERMDLTRRSAFAIVQSRDFNRRSRMDRRLERAATTTKKQRLSEGRTVLSFESRLFSLDKRMEESNLRQDVRLRENDSNRRIRSGTLRDSRNENRENIFPVQNILLQQKSAGTLERRDSNQNVKERSRVDRGLERDLPADKLQSLSDRRSKRSVESRFLSLDRRIRNSDLRQDNRQQENDSTRRTRSEIRESRNENGEKISTVQNTVLRQILERQERRDSTPPSAFAGIQSRDFEGRSRMERRLQRETPTEKQQFLSERRLGRVVSTDKDHHLSERRSLVSSQSRVLSPDRRTRNSDLRRDNRQQENDSTRRIRSENREYRNENRESISPAQNTLLQQKSPEHQDRRDSTRRSAFASIQSRDFEGRSRMDRRLERDLPADKIQSLSDRRSKRSVESRVLSLDRRTRNSDLRRDNRQQENDSTRRIRSEIRESRNENRESISPAQNTLLREKSPERQDRRDSTRRSAFASIQSRDFEERSRMDRRLERDLPAEKLQFLSDRRSKRSVESRVLSLDRITRNSDLRRDNRQQENDSTRRIRSEVRDSRNENRLRDVRERNEELVRSQRALDRRNLQIQKSKERRTLPDRVHISLERKFEASIISEKLNNYDRREKVSRINQRYIQERGTTLNKRGSDVRLAKTTSLERLLVSTDKSFDKVQIKRREERYLDNAQNRLSDSSTFDIENRASRSERFIRVRRDTQEIRDTSNKQFLASGFDQRRISNVLIQEKHDDESRLQTRKNAKTVQRRTTYDSVRHFKRQETVGNNKRILSQEKQIRNELMTSTIKMRNDISYSKQSTRSSLRHAESPELKSTQEAVSMRRHDSVLDISQNYDEFQIFNAQKNAPFFPSWIGEMISVLKKAVTGNDTEENILKHPLDLGLSWINKYLPGFSYELQIPKLRPDSEMSNDKGHLLQDVVMGSVIAGYFVSSIHLKMRDYQNFICIF